MISHNYSSLSDVTNLLSKSCFCSEFKDSPKEKHDENFEDSDTDDSLDFEEVFTDHILMKERLRKTLYAGNFCGFEDLPEHPPIALTGLALELFSKAAPNYGLDILDMDYVSAASEAAKISPCAMIIAMIYLERLQLKNHEYLETVSPPGLFVVTMLVASKFLFEDEEDIATNQLWAEALNFDIKDLNSLERDFLSAIDWKVFVNSSEYFTYMCNVEKVVAVKQSSLRNWLSYSDIFVLSQDPAFLHVWNTFFKKFMKTAILWTFGYAATALALYSMALTIQKQKTEQIALADKNDTAEMRNSVFTMVEKLQAKNTEFIDNFSSSSLGFNMHNEKPASCSSLNRNCYKSLSISERKVSVYKVEITFPSQRLQIDYNYFLKTPESINNSSHFNRKWLDFRRNLCVSVLMR